jgi:hypothetical protein
VFGAIGQKPRPGADFNYLDGFYSGRISRLAPGHFIDAWDPAFGIAHDGVTDDTAGLKAFQAAVKQSSHKTGYLRAAKYVFGGTGTGGFGAGPGFGSTRNDNLFSMVAGDPDGIEIFGAGMGKTILQHSCSALTGDYGVFAMIGSGSTETISTGCRGHKVHDLTIVGDPNVSGTFNWFGVYAKNMYAPEIYNVEIYNIYGAGNSGGGGIQFGNVWNMCERQTTLGTAVGSAGSHTCTPTTGGDGTPGMTDMYLGRPLWVGGASPEIVYVSAMTATTFTATFVNTHLSTDSLILRCNNRMYGKIHDCYIHDSRQATGILLGASRCEIINNRVFSIGATSLQHGMYITGGYNLIKDNKACGIGGFSYHGHATSAATDASGNIWEGNESLDPNNGHLVLDALIADGTNPEMPNGVSTNRYATVDANVFRLSLNAILNGAGGSSVTVQGVAEPMSITFSDNLFQDAHSAGNWLQIQGNASANITAKGNRFFQVLTTLTGLCFIDTGAGSNSEIVDNFFSSASPNSTNQNRGIKASTTDIVRGNTLTGVWGGGGGGIISGGIIVQGNRTTSTDTGANTPYHITNFTAGADISGNILTAAGASAPVVRFAGTENLSFHENSLVSNAVCWYDDSSSTLRIYNNDGFIEKSDRAVGATLVTRSFGPLLPLAKGSAVINNTGILVKVSAGLAAQLATTDTVFTGISVSDNGSTATGIYVAGQKETQFLGAATDGAWTAGNIGIPSVTSAGKLHDTGLTTIPSAGSCVRFKDTGGASGNAWVVILRTDEPAYGSENSRVNADVTNASTTFAAITGLTGNLNAGRKYIGKVILKCNDSTAADGIKLDFNGGTATMTSFWAAASEPVGGTTVLGTAISTSLAGVINWTTITGETVIEVNFSLVCNAAGTLIPRQAQNSHSTGTLTVELGSLMEVMESP